MGRHAFHFSPWGDVVHSFAGAEGLQRIVLLWRLEGETLLTTEAASAHVTRTAIGFDEAGRLTLGTGEHTTRYVADSQAEPFDAASGAYAFGALALRHGMAQVARGEPFEPFLLFRGETLDVARFHYPTPETAEEAGQRKAESLPSSVGACAWVYDAFITSVADQLRSAAVMAIVSERGVPTARVFAQRYRHSPQAQALGPMAVAGQRPGWLT
jgi:hypothetical protein